jgi:hypothetical protein
MVNLIRNSRVFSHLKTKLLFLNLKTVKLILIHSLLTSLVFIELLTDGLIIHLNLLSTIKAATFKSII